MAYGLRWTISFDSRTGKACRVLISDKDYTGNVTQLTGAAVPFETQEDDDEDVFSPIRGQTGYIRIVTDNVGLVDAIAPSNNLQHLVTLEVDGAVRWRGFQQTDVFEQEWRGGMRELELPVNSLLASLESTELSGKRRTGFHKISSLIYDVFNWFGITLSFRGIWNIPYYEGFYLQTVHSSLFFENSTEEGEEREDKLYSMSGKEVMEAICKLYGLTMRESGDTIYFVAAGGVAYGVSNALTLNQLDSLTGTRTPVIHYEFSPQPIPLDDWVNEWRGDKNTESRIKPVKSVSLTLDIQKHTDEEIVTFPDITEEARTSYDMSLSTHILHVQPYVPSWQDAQEGNPYLRGFAYAFHNPWKSVAVQGSECYMATTEAHAPWKEWWDGQATLVDGDTPANMYSGAFPCRWSADSIEGGQSSISATNGYYLALIPVRKTALNTGKMIMQPILGYTTAEAVEFDGGYIGIELSLLSIMEGYYIKVIGDTCNYSDTWRIERGLVALYVSVIMDGKHWDGTAWTSEIKVFPLNIENGTVVTNYSETMGIDQCGGYLIPVGNITSSTVQVQICEYAGTSSSENVVKIGRGHFMSGFKVKYHRPSSSTSLLSDRTENKYYARTGAGGYAGAKHTDLVIGTCNYNRPSDSFLGKEGSYTETIDMTLVESGQPRMVQKRIEEELLARMKTYYSAARRMYEAQVELNKFNRTVYDETQGEYIRVEIDMPIFYPTVNNRSFMAIDADHDWRDDTQTIKLIEQY